MRNSSGDLIGEFEFRQAPLGAGGFVTGLDISSDGARMVHWTDVWNGYIRNTGEDTWRVMLRDDTLSEDFSSYPGSTVYDSGGYAARIAPSDKDVIYFVFKGFIFKSVDGGETFSRLPNWTPREMESNRGPQRRFAFAMDVHPSDPDQFILGTNAEGIYYSTDGGASFSSPTGVPFSTMGMWNNTGKFLAQFDKGNPDHVYIQVPGKNHVSFTVLTGGHVHKINHGLSKNTPVVISTTGALPTGLAAATTYYVVGTTQHTFKLAVTVDGDPIEFTGSQSGEHTFTPSGKSAFNANILLAGTAIMNCGGHSLTGGETLKLTTLGTLPEGLDSETTYYVKDVSPFNEAAPGNVTISLTNGGPAIEITDVGVSNHIASLDVGGVYRSTTGLTGTFSLIEGSPKSISCLVTTASGTLYVCDFRLQVGSSPTDPLKKLVRGGSSFTTIPGTTQFDQVAVDPFDEDHIVACNENGGFKQTFNGGDTWTGYNKIRGDGEIAWISNRSKPMYPAHLMFDPVIPNKLWIAEGIGVNWSNPPLNGEDETWVFHDYSRGNEELVPNSAFSSPGNPPILCCWDKPFWRIEDKYQWSNMWSYPVAPDSSFNEGTVTVGYCVDYAIDDPQYLVGVAGQGYNIDGYSTDGGKTWTQFVNKCASFGGWVAVSNKNNIIRTATNNGPAQYTLDGGDTWHNVAFGGQDPVTHWSNAYYVIRENITADKTRPGVFAALVNGIIPDSPSWLGRENAGVWLTEDGGQTWTHKFYGVIQTAFSGGKGSTIQYWQSNFKFIPGKTGELLYADRQGHAENYLWYSIDDGETWADMHPSVRNVTGFGFGKAAPGQNYPAVYMTATVNGVSGVYVSLDWFATTPVLLARRPLGHIGAMTYVGGDMNVFGDFYIALNTQGFAACSYAKKFSITGQSVPP